MTIDIGVLQEQVGHIREVMAERDLRYEARFIASERAVTIALQAQKEAAEKAERSAETRHADLVTQLNKSVGNLTDRITTLALRYEGTVGGTTGQERLWGYLVGAVGIAVAVASVAFR